MEASHAQLLQAATDFLWGDEFLDAMDDFIEQRVGADQRILVAANATKEMACR